MGYGDAEWPLRVIPKRPLTCINMVGDTGIEPATSSVSGTGNAFAEVRPRASVQVRAVQSQARSPANTVGHDPVGVRVGVRVRWAVEANMVVTDGALIR